MKNNKGFSLVEVLVTVGLIGVLIGIGVPSYKGYKKRTVKMALRADVGTGVKAYSAQYAVESTYCFTFDEVGLSVEDKAGNPSYRRQGFYGFGTIGGNCNELNTAGITAISFKSDGGFCQVNNKRDASRVTNADCSAVNGSWKTNKKNQYGDKLPKKCSLDDQEFKIGAYSGVSDLKTMIMGDHRGVIREDAKKEDCW